MKNNKMETMKINKEDERKRKKEPHEKNNVVVTDTHKKVCQMLAFNHSIYSKVVTTYLEG